MFEQLGWMILAHRDGYGYKIADYKKSLKHLKLALEEKVAKTQDPDRKDDLLNLHRNVISLIAHVDKDFKTPARV